VIGSCTFDTVCKATWRGMLVATKVINTSRCTFDTVCKATWRGMLVATKVINTSRYGSNAVEEEM